MTRQQHSRLVSYAVMLQTVLIASDRNIAGPRLASALLSPWINRRFRGEHTNAFPGSFINTFPLWQQVDDSSRDLYTEIDLNEMSALGNHPIQNVFDEVVNARYACTRFQRYQEPVRNYTTSSTAASVSNPMVVKTSLKCLSISQRAPTGFNAQPYRVILVHDHKQKMALSEYCLGRNADRVRDADCTAIFLSDEQVGRDWEKFKNLLLDNADGLPSKCASSSRSRRPLSTKALKTMRILILLFSSGYPLPRVFARPLSFCLRFGVSILAFAGRAIHVLKQKLSRSRLAALKSASNILPRSLILPTLSSSETWSQKNTMLVAMTYMLACTSRGLSTCPMEGFDAQGIRDALNIPRRFGIPLIVSTGTQYIGDEGVDDVGVSHGDGSMTSPRYHLDEVLFENVFGCFSCPA